MECNGMAAKDKNMSKTKDEIIKNYFDKIEKRDGTLTPQAVVKEAKPVDSPLHRFFQWDDSKAASEYRLWQARQLIRTVMIVREEGAPVRAFQSVVFVSSRTLGGEDDAQERAYVSTTRALADKNLRKQILTRAKQEAQDWADKYEALEELAAIVKVIRQ